MKIAIAGSGQKVLLLSESLLREDHRLVIINSFKEECERLSLTNDAVVICGDGSKKYILDDADIYGFDLMIAVQPNDSDNLVTCLMAKNVYGISRVFANVVNPRNIKVFNSFGINTSVSAAYELACIIEQVTLEENRISFVPLNEKNMNLAEVTIAEGNSSCGKRIMDLFIPHNIIIGCIIRESKTLVSTEKTVICAGDRIMLFTETDKLIDAVRLFTGGES
jgi:trk system potassium uptake protein TrkA